MAWTDARIARSWTHSPEVVRETVDDASVKRAAAVFLSRNMGLAFSSLWQRMFGKEERRILMVGLDAAGKTTILSLDVASSFRGIGGGPRYTRLDPGLRFQLLSKRSTTHRRRTPLCV